MRLLGGLLALSLTMNAAPASAASPILGSPCPTVGKVAVIGKNRAKCTFVGKKRIWVRIAKSTSSAPPPSVTKSARERAETFALSDRSGFEPLALCQIGPSNWTASTSSGYPRISDRIPSLGMHRGIAIVVDFPDLPATGDEHRVWKTQQIPTFERAIAQMSYGKAAYSIDLPTKVFRIDKSVLSYNLDTAHGMPIKPNADFGGLIRDAVRAADTDVDFSTYDFVNVVTPATDKIGFEGATNGPGAIVTADGKGFKDVTFGPIREYKDDVKKYSWLLHEVGHLFGFQHPFKAGAAAVGWDVMMNPTSFANELFAWHRMMLNWLDSSQVDCLDARRSGKSTLLLAPLADSGPGVKALVVRLSASKVLVVENRRASSIDMLRPENEGVIAYTVDVSVPDNLGSVALVFAQPRSRDGVLLGNLIPGESVIQDNVRVQVLSSAVAGDYVQVTIS